MSNATVYTPPHIKVCVSTETIAEAAIRVPVSSRNGRWGISKSNVVRAKQNKLAWPDSKAHPEGAKFWGWWEEIDPMGFVTLDDESLHQFDEHDYKEARPRSTFMLKIVGRRQRGLYMAVARLSETCRLDDTEPYREDGRCCTSLPLYLTPGGEDRRFVFVISISGSSRDRATVRVDQVTVTRPEPNKFHMTTQKRFERESALLGDLDDLLERQNHMRNLKPRIMEAVQQYIKSLAS